MSTNRGRNIGFLSLGAAGSNIAEVADIAGYRAAVMNTAQDDLDAITTITNKFKIGTSDGCGKDRNIAKEQIRQNYQDIIKFVRNTFDSSIELIYVCFSTGGGTGSGGGPIVTDILTKMMPEKKFAAIAVLPASDESVVAQYNTLECLNELFKLELPTLLADNQKYVEMVGDVRLTKKQLFDSINESIIEDFDAVFKKRVSSKYGNIDQRDLMKLLCTPGYQYIVTTHLEKEDLSQVSKTMIDNLQRSIYTDIEFDNVVKRMGFIFDIPDYATKSIVFEDIQREVGKPLELFEGVYNSNDDKHVAISIFTGLSFPEKRIREIKAIINKDRNEIGQAKSISVFDQSDFSWFGDMRSESKPTPTQDAGEIDLNSLFSNY